MKTVITELLGIEYPVIQGGMAWVGTAELAAAVSEAGGLGIIGAGGAPASWVEEQIHKVKEKLPSKAEQTAQKSAELLQKAFEKSFDIVLEKGSSVVQSSFGLSSDCADVLQGIILFFILGCELFIRYQFVFRGKGGTRA